MSIESPPNFSWIDESICAFAFPSCNEHFAFLQKCGVNTIISLTEGSINLEAAELFDIRVIHLPITDYGVPTKATENLYLQIVDEVISKGKKLGIHCRYGLGRTGSMACLYLIKFKKMNPSEALSLIRKNRPGSVESNSQKMYVLSTEVVE